jgi:tRNA G18 (ribose-2'-O)-methylase SpoU
MRKLLNEELNRLSIKEFKEAKKIPVVVVLDNIRSLNNIGSAFRTSDAFRVESIYLCGITSCPPHRDIQKTALGATESVNWRYFKDTADAVKQLKENDYTIISIEQVDTSIKLNEFTPEKSKRYALIFGNEVKGVSDEVVNESAFCIEIPQFGTKHSLNISVSVGIVLWHFVCKGNLFD